MSTSKKSLWLTLLIPLLAFVVSGWAVYKYFDEKGPLIKVEFDSADGLEEGKTPLKYHGVSVGIVEKLEISEDLRKVIIEIRLVKKASHIANKGAKFWIVRPELSVNAFKNLEAIVGGDYIAVELPDDSVKSDIGSEFCYFLGEENGIDGATKSIDDLILRLEAHHIFSSTNIGSKVFYKGYPVGLVEAINLPNDGKKILLTIRIYNKYSHLVRNNSVFWDLKTLDMKWKLMKGLMIETISNPVRTALEGGVAFASPPEKANRARTNQSFRLNDNFEHDWVLWEPSL